jgi:hypothetical protein
MKSFQKTIREERQLSDADNGGFFINYPQNPILKESVVKRIDFNTASTIILKYEWIGTMPLPKSCRFIYGIYFDNILGGAIVYVHPSTRQFEKLYARQVVQLNRGACSYWTPKNTASKLIAESLYDLKKNKIKLIIAYCTKEAGEIGTIYQALGWWYVGETSPSKVYFLDNHWVSERTLADKKKWAKSRGEKWINKFETLQQKQLQGKYKYIKLLGTKKENEGIINVFNYQQLLYPKRIN